MHPRSIAFVESNTTGSGEAFFHKALQRGCQPVLLTAKPGRWTALPEEVDVIRCDTRCPTSVQIACSSIAGLSAIWSSSDSFVGIAAQAAKLAALPGPDPESVHATRDKHYQRLTLDKAGVPQPGHFLLRTHDDVAPLLSAHGPSFPLVLKPRFGTGKVGVRLVNDPVEFADHARMLFTSPVSTGLPAEADGILAEEFVAGEEFSVEVFHGTAIAVVRKRNRPPTFLETGHSCPAGLPPGVERQVMECALAAVAALGLCWGPVHVELKLTPAGRLAIIEVNPRLAGGNIPRLVEIAYGVDMVGATLDLCLGSIPDIKPVRFLAGAIVFLIPDRAGVLEAIEGLEKVRSMTGVAEVLLYRKRGDVCQCDGTFRERIGQILACGTGPDEAERHANAALSALRLKIRPTPYSDECIGFRP
jgi:biotin carboxylase